VSRVDEQLAAARAALDGSPEEAARLTVRGAPRRHPPRRPARRVRFDPGALVIERNNLEWRLDPTSPDRHPAVTDEPGRPVVVLCQEGYASSLAARLLQDSAS